MSVVLNQPVVDLGENVQIYAVGAPVPQLDAGLKANGIETRALQSDASHAPAPVVPAPAQDFGSLLGGPKPTP